MFLFMQPSVGDLPAEEDKTDNSNKVSVHYYDTFIYSLENDLKPVTTLSFEKEDI